MPFVVGPAVMAAAARAAPDQAAAAATATQQQQQQQQPRWRAGLAHRHRRRRSAQAKQAPPQQTLLHFELQPLHQQRHSLPLALAAAAPPACVPLLAASP